MSWYIWLIIILVFGSLIAGLLRLRNSADEMPIDKHKLELMRKNNAEMQIADRLQDD
ncbi:DUF2897 family protein [Pseudomonas sp. C27(2019)]|uniref:DUF2897 family protein n=1 Tax=Pseudomonas sp. C27(2019) TaxID=2604941 RepID=UPI0012456A08|nr:DUF2897 family protein [Pseudomonas sp. C27(2019)]QEY58974.1 DUF2897 family protein [Pseudomonas sp. C27(2019)]